jgi:hypothetical protein
MSKKKGIAAESIRELFSRRKMGDRQFPGRPQEALLFDTISVQAVCTLRGQNPFPEEEGELCSMYPRIRERPLLMR